MTSDRATSRATIATRPAEAALTWPPSHHIVIALFGRQADTTVAGAWTNELVTPHRP